MLPASLSAFCGEMPREDVIKAMQNKEALQAAEICVAKASTDEPGRGVECFPIPSYGK
jgi:hypothetical protein